jgi:hypothetical protein
VIPLRDGSQASRRAFANVIGIRGRGLGGARLTQRLGKLADSLSDRPGESFPKALDDAQLEAAYRFFGNDQVTPEAILALHFRRSASRAAALPRIIVLHCTTAFEFAVVFATPPSPVLRDGKSGCGAG